MNQHSTKTTHILLGIVAVLLLFNIADRWISPGHEDSRAPQSPVLDKLVTPAQAQVMSQIGRVYTTSDDGRTLVEWRHNNRIWTGRAFTAEDAEERW